MATWQIETLKYTNNADKVVTQAHWRCSATKEVDGELYTAANYGSVALDDIAADAEGFVAYADLTESKCLEWVHAKVDKTGTEEAAQTAVDAQTNPPVKAGKPWA